MLIAPYSVAVHARDGRRAVAGCAIALAGALAAGLLVGDDVVFILVLVGIACAAGMAVRRLGVRSTELEARAARLDEQARTAAAEERERIARELHDIVSHSVSLMVVQAGAAEQVLRQDPDQARAGARRHPGHRAAPRWTIYAGCSACCADAESPGGSRRSPGSRRSTSSPRPRARPARRSRSSAATCRPARRASTSRPTGSSRRR